MFGTLTIMRISLELLRFCEDFCEFERLFEVLGIFENLQDSLKACTNFSQ